MEMLDIVLSFVPHYTRWDVLRYIDFQEEKTMNRTHLSVRMLCEAAVMVALAQILSYLKLMELPNGGSLTPAMFPIILFAVRWGTAPGLMAGFVFGLLQLIFDGAYAWGWQSMLLDYLAPLPPWDWPACSRAGPGASLPARWWAAPGGSWSTTSAG